MKRCPKCNRTFESQTQKFCTQDGTSLIDEIAAPPPEIDLKETIRIDSAPLAQMLDEDDDFETKPISREQFDPYKTTVNPPPDPYKTVVSKSPETVPGVPFDTSDLRTPAPPSTAELFGASLPPPAESQPPSVPQPPPAAPQPASVPHQPSVTPPSRISIPTTMPPPAQTPAAEPAAVGLRPAKKSKLPLVLGILAVLFLIGIGAGGALYWFVARPMLEKKRATLDRRPTPAPTSTTRTTPEPKKNIAADVPPYSPPSDAVEFVNSSDNLDGKLKEHYVDFSFYYPESWQKDPKAGVPGATNFAKVERRLPPDFTQENFAVGWYASAGSEEGDRAAFPKLAENMSAQLEKGFTDYRKISEGPTSVGVYNGYEFRFESASQNTERGDIKIWGRVIFLPPVDGGKNGVTLLMLATSLARELKSADDVGVKGDLPMLLESFRFGK